MNDKLLMVNRLEAMPKYEAYKDSGVEWINKIPKHWSVKRLKFICENIQTGTTPSTQNEKYFHGNVNWFNPSDLNNTFLINSEKKISHLALKKNEAKLFRADSILIVGIGATTGKTSYLAIESSFNQQITGFHSRVASNKFLYYVLSSFSTVMLSVASFTTLPILNNEFFKAFWLVLPLPKEQTAIANFLDQKTTQIDQAIAIKEKQISLLKERKQILIQNAVTRGLNPDAPMRDSGVEWIGEIPEHWEVKPGFTFFSENKRKNKGMIEDVVLSLSYGQIIIKPKEKLTGLVPESFETYQIVELGDIIVRCMDLQNDQTSLRTGLAMNRGIITSAYLSLKVKECYLPNFIYYYLHALDISKVLYKFGSGLRQNLNFIDFKRMPVLDVPINEQKAIVAHIEAQSTKINTAIKLQNQQIQKLKEYKTTLINSAVTGKIKIPTEELV